MTVLTRILKKDDRWIPALFVAGFVLVLVANGTMIWLAIGTFNGLETEQAYRKGLAYNETLAAAAAQRELGWQVELAVEAAGGDRHRIAVDLSDSGGEPLSGVLVAARFERPTQSGHDFDVLLRADGAGRYEGEFDLPMPGVWDVVVEADRRGTVYRDGKRVVIEP